MTQSEDDPREEAEASKEFRAMHSLVINHEEGEAYCSCHESPFMRWRVPKSYENKVAEAFIETVVRSVHQMHVMGIHVAVG